MNYMLYNFLKGNHFRRNAQRGIKQVIIDEDFKDDVVEAVAQIKATEGSLNKTLCLSVDGDNDIDLIGNIACEKIGIPYEGLEHTEENPLIMVATRKVQFYEGIPTYIKYITLKEGVLITLISGLLNVQTDEGEFVQLRRCCSDSDDVDVYEHTAKDFEGVNLLKDTETGIPYVNNVVNDCIVTIKMSKDFRVDKRYSFNRDCFVTLDQEIFVEGKEKAEKLRQLQEEAKAKRERERANFQALQSKKAQEREEKEDEKRRKALEKRQKAKAKSEKGKEVTGEVKTLVGSEGAASFRAFIARKRAE